MKNTLSLILLVGGKSSRMGQDKSALKLSLFPQINRIDKKNSSLKIDFFEHALILLSSLSKANPHIKTEIKISCRANQDKFMQEKLSNLDSSYDFELLFDNGVGVCEAIQICLEKTKTPCLFIPCDTPFLTVDILQQLVDAWHNNKNTFSNQNKSYINYVFSKDNTQKKQSLIAIYTQEAIPYLEASIEAKMPLQKAIPSQFVKILYYNNEQEKNFQNLNTEEDLKQAKNLF